MLSILVTGAAWVHAASLIPVPAAALTADQFRIGAAGGYLNARSNYDLSGSKTTLSGTNSFQSITATFFGEYGATEEVTVFARGAGVANSVTGTSTATGAKVNASNSGVGDAEAGLRVTASKTPVPIVLEGSALFPLYSRLPADEWAALTGSSTVPLGTGASEFGVKISAAVPVSPGLEIAGSVGYTLRMGGFSNLLPYTLHLRYEEARGFFGRVGIVGQSSVTDDLFKGTPTANDRATTVIAGSLALNAINPTFTKVDAVAGTHLGDQAFVSAGVQYPLTAKSAPGDLVVIGALGIEFGEKDRKKDYTASNRGFQEYYLAAKVVRANNALRQVLIDKGSGDGIHAGELLDVFEPDRQDGSFGETVGRGRVLEVGPTRTKVEILEYFKEGRVEEGFVVRRPVR